MEVDELGATRNQTWDDYFKWANSRAEVPASNGSKNGKNFIQMNIDAVRKRSPLDGEFTPKKSTAAAAVVPRPKKIEGENFIQKNIEAIGLRGIPSLLKYQVLDTRRVTDSGKKRPVLKEVCN